MLLEINYFMVNLNKNVLVKEEKISFRKNQLTIAKKKDDFKLSTFILDKLLKKNKLDYIFVKEIDNLCFYVDYTKISKGLHTTLNKIITIDFKDSIKNEVRNKIKELNMIVFKIDNKKKLIDNIVDSEFNKYIKEVKENKSIKIKPKQKPKVNSKIKESINNFNLDISSDDSDSNSDSNINSDTANEINSDSDNNLDELDELDELNDDDIELEALEDLHNSDDSSDTSDEDHTNLMNNTLIYLNENIIKKESDISCSFDDLYNTRKKMINLFKKLLDKHISYENIRKIEVSLFNYCIIKCKERAIIPTWDTEYFPDMYNKKAMSLYLNLDEKLNIKNNYLLNYIKNTKDFDFYNIAFLPRKDIFPKIWVPLIEENKRKQEIINQSENEASTNSYKCPNRNCGARKAIFKEAQTRSADEPMTVFITCLVCGKRWKD